MVNFNNEEYDNLYQEIDSFIKRVNPCKVSNGKCLRGRILGQRNFCRQGCNSLSDNGCTAVKPISCRIWLCEQAYNSLSNADKKEQERLEHLVESNNFGSFRLSKEELKSARFFN